MIADICIRCARLLAPALFLTITMSLSVVSVLAQSATFARTDYPLLGNNHAVADFNGDGNLDLAGVGGNSADVMLGNGDGTFRAKVQYPAGGPTQDLAPGDFNGDGKVDLVVTINDPQIGLSQLTGNGDGTFNAPVNSPNTTQLDSPAVVATDVDNDGKLDVVVAHVIGCYTAPCQTGWTISLLLGNGDGTFQPSRDMIVGTGMSRIAVGDFNRDGIRDLAIAGDRSRVYILLGIGNGSFGQQTMTLTPDTFGVDATDVDVADFNGDAVQDLVVAIALNGSRTAILIGNGDGTFRQPLIITEPNQRIPQYQSVADFNGDGRQDIAIGLGWGVQGLLEILNGNGDGTFQQPVLYLVPPPQSSISGGVLAAGDFNKDGKPDIALQITGASPGLAALRNTSGAAPAPAPPPRGFGS
ncbi:MAG: VCBS repeat-containing protein, partial [Acidobacteria bacterium]|nr:VCBS repeat-containing protein [Acidobacteriota bacterium]